MAVFAPNATQFKDVTQQQIPVTRAVASVSPSSSTPPPGGRIGDELFVESTQKLYICSGFSPTSGWSWFLAQAGAASLLVNFESFSSTPGVPFPASGAAPVANYQNILSGSSIGYQAGAYAGYSTPLYTPLNSSSNITFTLNLPIFAQSTSPTGASVQLLSNMLINAYTSTSSAAVWTSGIIGSAGSTNFAQTLTPVITLNSSSHVGGVSLLFCIFFDSGVASSGMGACINGAISTTTNLVEAVTGSSVIGFVEEYV